MLNGNYGYESKICVLSSISGTSYKFYLVIWEEDYRKKERREIEEEK